MTDTLLMTVILSAFYAAFAYFCGTRPKKSKARSISITAFFVFLIIDILRTFIPLQDVYELARIALIIWFSFMAWQAGNTNRKNKMQNKSQ